MKPVLLFLLPLLTVVPVSAQAVFEPQAVRALPGGLDNTLVFNSNSPELVQGEGVLLSTFPSNYGLANVHLNQPLNGRFDLFIHHIAQPNDPTRTLYLGVLLHNPGTQPVVVDILAAASYLTQPDAPFIGIGPVVDNLAGAIYGGPGDRVALDLLRGLRQSNWPGRLEIPAGSDVMLMNLPVPTPPNGRSTLLRLHSSGPLYGASLALYGATDGSAPRLDAWQTLLKTGNLATPRDLAPTPLDQKGGRFIYGRVSGVVRGSQWQGDLGLLSIPAPGQSISYVLNTANFGTLGTGQVQSAPLVARYPDTAYRAHGNYGISYHLSATLTNASDQPQPVTLAIQSPRKSAPDQPEAGLWFLEPPSTQVTYRGTVRIRYNDANNLPQTRYVHLVLHSGERGEPLINLTLPPQAQRLLLIDFIYPADCTPPQVLTFRTLPIKPSF